MNAVMRHALRANLVKFNIVCQIICSRASSCCKLHINVLSRLNVEALKTLALMVHADVYETACCRRLYCLHVNENRECLALFSGLPRFCYLVYV